MIRRWQERIYWRIAYLLPARLVYFVAIRLIAHGTVGKYGNTVVPELSAMDAIKRFSDDHFVELGREHFG